MLNLSRDILSKIAGGNPLAIRQLEKAFGSVEVLPTTIEEANALAGTALALAQAAMSSLALLAEALGHLESAPRAHLGTIASQNADAVEITGGTLDGVPIGSTTAAAAKFTTVAASGQITSTVATGVAPLVVASITRVPNLNAATAGTADSLANPTTYPPAATDLPTVITLANALLSAATAKGL